MKAFYTALAALNVYFFWLALCRHDGPGAALAAVTATACAISTQLVGRPR